VNDEVTLPMWNDGEGTSSSFKDEKENCTKGLEGEGLLRLLRHNSQGKALKLNDSKEKVSLGRIYE